LARGNGVQPNYGDWCSLSDEELAQRDIAEGNLVAAYNLPYAGKLDILALQNKLDDWADVVDDRTRRAWRKRARGDYAQYNGDQFRILAMITVLQRHLAGR
jgi:hypothetical protein